MSKVSLKPDDTCYTAEEYLALERGAPYKSEYVDGEIFALAGASEPHNLIVTNCVGELWGQLKGKPCKLYSSDMRVQLAKSRRYTYPDLVIVCGKAGFTDDTRDTLTNPTLIIEVLSPSTESYDRGEKFEQYRKLNSLQTYVLISQDKPLLEVFERQAGGRWLLSEYGGLDASAPLPNINCELQLVEVYDRIEFEEVSSTPPNERDETDS